MLINIVLNVLNRVFDLNTDNKIENNTTVDTAINGNKSMEEGYNDTFVKGNNSQKDINTIYNKINTICEENGINIQEAKDAKLLENIAGCTTEELISMDEKDLDLVLESLKSSLGHNILGLNKNKDIDKIIHSANKKYVLKMADSNLFKQTWFNLTTKNNLLREIKSEGIEVDENNIESIKNGLKTYFNKKYFEGKTTSELKQSFSIEKLEEMYSEALEDFAHFLNKYIDAKDKVIITSIIEELKAGDRGKAAKMTFASCKGDAKAKEAVAVAIDENAMHIAGKADAFGERMSINETIDLRVQAYNNMGSENREKSYNRMLAVANEYQALLKKEADGTISEQELLRLNELKSLNINELYINTGYSAAIISLSMRNDVNQNDYEAEFGRIKNDIETLNIKDQVASFVFDYLNDDNNNLNISNNRHNTIEAYLYENNDLDTNYNTYYYQNQNRNEDNIVLKDDNKINYENKADKSNLDQESNIAEISEVDKKNTSSDAKSNFDSNDLVETPRNHNNIDKTLEKSTTNIIKSTSNINEYVSKYGFNNYMKEAGSLVDILNETTSSYIKDLATEMFEQRNTAQQVDTIKRLNSGAISAVLPHSKVATIRSLDGTILPNSYSTQLLKEANKELKEKEEEMV